jgi:hypothetical protein
MGGGGVRRRGEGGGVWSGSAGGLGRVRGGGQRQRRGSEIRQAGGGAYWEGSEIGTCWLVLMDKFCRLFGLGGQKKGCLEEKDY